MRRHANGRASKLAREASMRMHSTPRHLMGCLRTHHGATYGVEHSADALVELAAWFNAEFVLVRV